MPIHDILLEGDSRLRQKAIRIRAVDESLRKLAAEMFETMHAAPGVGLAAPQIGVMRRLIVVHVPESHDNDGEPAVTLALANPEIVRRHGRVLGYEGCLSIPGWTAEVPRAETVTVKAIDLDNKPVRIKAKGWTARVLQHEIDHLDGILFLDRVEDNSTIQPIPEDADETAAVEA
ncbi:MAG TPA: peptide deformylase [Thermomicrobiales bacterium]|nr:peptide deformylase [Thermomicrobiales bacterium]